MSYALSFRAGSVDALAERLRRPMNPTPDERAVVELIEAGGGQPGLDAARGLVATVRAMSTFLGAQEHGSSAGAWFQNELLEGVVAPLLGAEFVDHLLGRPLCGIITDEHPNLGWVRQAELAAAVARLDEPGQALSGQLDEESAEVVEDILAILRRAATTGEDLVTVYT